VFLARCFVTERDGKYYASLTGEQGSGILTSMMRANALTIIPAGIDVVEQGDEVEVLMLDWSRGEEWGSYLSGGEGGPAEGPAALFSALEG